MQFCTSFFRKSFVYLFVISMTLTAAMSVGSAATLTVTSTNDIGGDGECGLVEAFLSVSLNFAADAACGAGESGNMDIIQFDESMLPAYPGVVTFTLTNPVAVSGGDLRIDGPDTTLAQPLPRIEIAGDGTTDLINVSQAVGGRFEVNDVVIRDANHADDGAAVSILDGTGVATFTNVHFRDNITTGRGAAIWVNSNNPLNLDIIDSIFETNSADTNGGAVALLVLTDAAINMDITGSTFIGNETQGDGGAVWIRRSGTDSVNRTLVNIIDTVFESNESQDSGGAMYYNILTASLGIADSHFTLNRSIGGLGGALLMQGGSLDSVTLQRNSFYQNSAASGAGAMLIDDVPQLVLNNEFVENTTGLTGGAIRIEYDQAQFGNVSHYLANTFYRNDGGSNLTSIAAEEIYIRLPPLNAGELVFKGNLISANPNDSDAACVTFSGDLRQLDGSENAVSESSCSFGSGNVVSSDFGITAIDRSDLIHRRQHLLPASSIAVDSWSAANCALPNGSPIENQLDNPTPSLSEKRPLQGNPLTNADCDPGANEKSGVTVTVSTIGAGSGTVTSDRAGIDCGSDCVAPFSNALGDMVTLTATPDPGSVFVAWTGDCLGQNDCNLALLSNRSVTAEFQPAPTFEVAVTLAGDGSGTVSSAPSGISCDPNCTSSFEENTSVTLSATPDANVAFDGWSGDCTGTGSCVLSMTENKSVTATFSALVQTLDVAVSGPGSVTSSPIGVDCPGDCTEDFTTDTSVALSAVAAQGAQFFGWSDDCTGTGACNVVMSQARTVGAEFDFMRTMTMSVTGMGSVTGDEGLVDCPANDCVGTYRDGTVVTYTATPESGWQFDGWSGDCAGAVGTTCDQLMGSDKTAAATFSQIGFDLTVALNGGGTGSVQSNPAGIDCPETTCTTSFATGTLVTLTPMLDPGMQFSGWSGDCSGTGSCEVTMDQARSVVALIEPADISVSVSLTGSGSGRVESSPEGLDCTESCSAAFDGGQTITLTATPDNGSFFIGWTGACAGQQVCSLFLDEAKTTSAMFSDSPVIFANGFE